MSRIVEDAQRSLRAQIDRMRVFVSRAVLDRGPPSPVVDFHALRLLVKHLPRHDIAALGRSLGSPRIDLDDVRARPEPSFLSQVLWVMALDRRWPQPVLREVEYVTGERSFKMELDLTYAPECTYFVEDPTPSLTRLLRLGGDALYDIGANVGFHSLTGSLYFEATHAFEPTPQTLRRLRRNVDLNRACRVTVHGVGLSSHDGEARLSLDDAHPGANSLVSPPGAPRGGVVDVPVFRLDSYRRAHALPAPSLIKIDVEGHECEVLAGAEETVDASRPTIFVEIHSTELLERFASRLPPSYDVYALPTRGALVPVSLRAPLGREHDFLFVDRSKKALLEKRLSEFPTAFSTTGI